MKKQFLIIGLSETTVITRAWLGSNGISTVEEHVIHEHHQATKDTELEALKFVEELIEETGDQFEHGILIRPVWKRK